MFNKIFQSFTVSYSSVGPFMSNPRMRCTPGKLGYWANPAARHRFQGSWKCLCVENLFCATRAKICLEDSKGAICRARCKPHLSFKKLRSAPFTFLGPFLIPAESLAREFHSSEILISNSKNCETGKAVDSSFSDEK